MYTVARKLASKENQYRLSVANLRETLEQEIPGNDVASDTEARDLLKALSFCFTSLHSDHYYRIAHRSDVVYHRGLFSHFYLSLLQSNKIWLIAGDASFFHENAHSKMAWVALDEESSDLVPCGAGVGQRLNIWEFATKEGLLRHPDGGDIERVSSLTS